ncbi:MAG: glycosyltransferase family 39 protein [Actinobacteria bacterium]|nr:glycosyltransferase family 39 protein [Actinomycetota bacterium]
MENKNRIIFLILIFFLALIIRIGFIRTLNNTINVWGDWWSRLGWQLATGKGFWVANPFFHGGSLFYAWRTPGFPFFLSIIYRIFGHNFLAAKIGLAVLSSLSAVLIYFNGKILVNEKTGIISSLIYVFYPAAIFWTGYLAPETLITTILLFFSLYFFLGEKHENSYMFFFAGVFLGLGVLVFSLFLVVLPIIIIYFLIKNKNLFIKGVLLTFAGFFLVVSPWIIRNYKIYRTFLLTSTEGGIVSYIANNPLSIYQPSGYWNPPLGYFKKLKGFSEIKIDRYLYMKTLSFIKHNPKEYASLVWERVIRFWRFYPHTFSGPGHSNYYKKYVLASLFTIGLLLLISFWGIILSFHKKRWKNFLFLYLLIFAWSAPLILFFKVVIRYREPIMPYMIIFVSFTISQLLDKKRKYVEKQKSVCYISYL